MTKKTLHDVTLVCVDTRMPTLALRAMQRCQQQLVFARALLLTGAGSQADLPPGIDSAVVHIESIEAYSHFMLRELLSHVHTSHLLVVQWDGWVTCPDLWRDEFLQYDYIGPPWVDAPDGCAVGNGGFSLRSRRLLEALEDPMITPTHPEDRCICVSHRQRLEQVHGMRFAPLELARQFAYEHEQADPATVFGFHGLFNAHLVLEDADLSNLLTGLSADTCASLPGRMLWRALLAQGRLDCASTLLRQASPAMPWRRHMRAKAQLWLSRQMHGARSGQRHGD